jgi:outer membrane lipoprotein-sorting protein
MNRRHPAIAVAVLLVAALARPAFAQTPLSADEIVAKNIAAKGGLEKIHSVQSMKQTGKLTLQGMETTLVLFGKRPNMVRQEMIVAGQTNINAFDGSTAWQLMPVMGMTSPVVVTGPMANSIKEQSDFDGPLIDYKTKGYKLELVGTEAMGDRKVYHLKLTNAEQQVQHMYIDTETNLERKIVSDSPIGPLEQELSDFREVDGVKVPFAVRTLANGVEQMKMVLQKVEINPHLDDTLFKMPKSAKD